MPILLRCPDCPEVRIVTAVELPLGLKIRDFAAILAADANLKSVKVFGFENPEVRFISFQGSSPGTHCPEAPASTVRLGRQEPPMQCVPRLEPWNEKEPASATGTIVNDFFVGILAPRFQLSEQVIRLPPERKLGKQGDLHFLGSEWKVVFGGATYLSKPSLGMSRCLKKLSDEFARK